MQREPDHYAVLDLPRTATLDEIKRRYRRLMRAVHPDANVDDPEANKKAALINSAFETLGDPARRRAYDATLPAGSRGPTPSSAARRPRDTRRDRVYAEWAEQDDWEDIVAAHVPEKRPPHVHTSEPLMEPAEVEVDMSELRESPRVRRSIRITNRCDDCTLTGDVSTSEPWVWGPVGRLTIRPGETVEFPIEIIARKVTFPGLSRVLFVANQWTGTVPVKITGYEPVRRRVIPATDSSYVRQRRRKWARR